MAHSVSGSAPGTNASQALELRPKPWSLRRHGPSRLCVHRRIASCLRCPGAEAPAGAGLATPGALLFAAMALGRGKSVDFGGYWQRHARPAA
jgi:hypothetical protein